jgi:predicted kinase
MNERQGIGSTTPPRPVLIVVGGLPGTGKSTLAAALGRELDAPVFAKDVVEASLWRSGVTADHGSWQVAEDLLTTLARAQVEAGASAVLDTVARVRASRDTWRGVAASQDATFLLVECICSDERLHRERLDGRTRGIPGWYELDWSDVEAAKARWEPWTDDRLVLDAVDPPASNLRAALDALATLGALPRTRRSP